MIRIMLAVGTLVVSGSTAAFAEASGYKCTIKYSAKLGDDGSPQTWPLTSDPYRNQEFFVDRASGRILGNTIRTQGFQPKVLDSGSDKWSYILIYTLQSSSHTHVGLLQVSEYQAGAIKPFLLVENYEVYMGTCTHLQ